MQRFSDPTWGFLVAFPPGWRPEIVSRRSKPELVLLLRDGARVCARIGAVTENPATLEGLLRNASRMAYQLAEADAAVAILDSFVRVIETPHEPSPAENVQAYTRAYLDKIPPKTR